jgi:exosome complex RNA-binding protein Csl4
MSCTGRTIWCFVLLVFLSGCATYKRASLPGDGESTSAEKNGIIVVHKGAIVRVTLSGGEIVTGKVIEVSSEALVLEINGALAPEKRTIPSSGVQKIEIEKFDRSEKRVAKTTAIVVVVGAVLFAAFLYSIRGLGDLN